MLTYTFHVSLPGHGRVWRKVELPAEDTLEDLHMAIQNAYNFDNDHFYSFFMSGKAWDTATEFTLPEDETSWGGFFEDDDAEDEDGEGFITEADIALADAVAGLPDPTTLLSGEHLETPTPEQLRAMFAQLKNDPQAREQFMQRISEQLGVPPMMAQLMLGNMDALLDSLSDDQLAAVLSVDTSNLEQMMDSEFGDQEAGDVRSAPLGGLALKKGKKFLYLFDYGDEWRFNVKVDAINKNADPTLVYPRLVESVGDAPVQYPDWEGDAAEWDEEGWEEEK